jgi:leader peptidase (prepilin peptidase) / N-methyltransferase
MYNLFAFIFYNSFLFRGTILFLFGLIIGSFLNVVIYRLPIILNRHQHNECVGILGVDMPLYLEKFSLLFPFSHCTACKAHVPFWSNIPLIGYFLLNGRCYNCRTKISIRYPLIELLTAILFVLTGYIHNDIVILPGLLFFTSIVLCLILIDYDTFLLPDELTLSLLWLGLLFNLQGVFAGSLVNAVIGAVVGYMLLWLVFWGFKLITKRDGMGYGDFKFLAAILAWIGYQGLVPVLLISSLTGIVYFIIAKFSGRLQFEKNTGHIPFGPFLGVAGLVVVLASKYLKLSMFYL